MERLLNEYRTFILSCDDPESGELSLVGIARDNGRCVVSGRNIEEAMGSALKKVPQVKTCRVCRETKPLSAFGILTTSRDGHSYRCWDCEKKRVAKYHRKMAVCDAKERAGEKRAERVGEKRAKGSK